MIPANLTAKHRLFFFASIGVTSMMVHLSVVAILVSAVLIPPLIANVGAFLVAFNVSYLGHKHLTFSSLHDEKQLQLPHFFMVASTAGLLNEFLYFLFLKFTDLNYLISLVIVVGMVSIFTFTASRFWACR